MRHLLIVRSARAVLLTCAVLLSHASQPMRGLAEYIDLDDAHLVGSASDISTLLDLLNASSNIFEWSSPSSHLRATIIETVPPPLPTHFDTALVAYFATDPANPAPRADIVVGRSQPGVVVGAFDGSGRQIIDLDDILKFPRLSHTLDMQASVLIHELVEVGISRHGLGYADAHMVGIIEQNATLATDVLARTGPGGELLGFGQRMMPPLRDTSRPLPHGIEVRIPFMRLGPRKPTFYDEVIVLSHSGGGSLDITSIRSGFVDTGLPWSETEDDVAIESAALQLTGDLDEDGDVDDADLNLFLSGLGNTHDQQDLEFLLPNFGTKEEDLPAGLQSVPEPSSLVLAAMAVLSLLCGGALTRSRA